MRRLTPDDREDITHEMNHELGNAEQREINRRVRYALARTRTPRSDMTTTDRLTQIEARLSAATAGPWFIDSIESGEHGLFVEEPNESLGCGGVTVAQFLTRPNAELLGHAPADLAALVAVARAVEALHQRGPNVGPVSHPEHLCTCGRIWERCPTVAAVQGLDS